MGRGVRNSAAYCSVAGSTSPVEIVARRNTLRTCATRQAKLPWRQAAGCLMFGCRWPDAPSVAHVTLSTMDGVDLKRALLAGTAYFLALFALGFVLGAIRVMFVAPRFGQLAATSAEVPIMLAAAFFVCRWVILHWQVQRTSAIRWAMVVWFLAALLLFETLLGATLCARTLAEQWAALATSAGLLGLFAQIIAALLPVFVGKVERQ